MDVLKNKSKKTYTYTSRYAVWPYYYNTVDKKYVYGITGNLSKNAEYSVHTIHDYDTLDSLALQYYGRDDYYWIIADFNDIIDPFIKLSDHYKFVYIPSLSGVKFK